jgi:hypothetical protein
LPIIAMLGARLVEVFKGFSEDLASAVAAGFPAR